MWFRVTWLVTLTPNHSLALASIDFPVIYSHYWSTYNSYAKQTRLQGEPETLLPSPHSDSDKLGPANANKIFTSSA